MVDLGFGASPTTTLELHRRLAARRPDVEVVGIEIEPERVARGRAAAVPGVSFALGGFEVPLPRGRQATVIRALNVLRQYDETEVAAHWHRMVERLEPDGVLVEGTCNEVGRVASWVDLTRDGPQSLTVSLRLSGLEHPSIVAERLPKVLIHRNVDGESVHGFLRDLDHAWTVNAGLSAYGPSQRFIAAVTSLRAAGWPVLGGVRRWRLGEVSVRWDAVAPAGYRW